MRILKEYTRDITVIVSNMFTYIDVKSMLYMFILSAQKRRMLFNIEQIKNNATLYTHYERIYQGYHDHSFKHVHEYRRQEQAK